MCCYKTWKMEEDTKLGKCKKIGKWRRRLSTSWRRRKVLPDLQAQAPKASVPPGIILFSSPSSCLDFFFFFLLSNPCFALHFIRISTRCCSTSLFSCAQDLVCTVVERREEEVAGRLFTPGDYAMSSNLGDIIIIIIADSIPLSDDHSVFHSFITKEYVSTIVLQALVVRMYG